MNIAIITVAYNRCDSLKRLLNSLDEAFYYDNKVTLIISVDKSNTDVVERFADEYQWNHGEKIVDKHEKNLGLRPHMMSLGKWFEQFDTLVVLEDDIVVSPSFYSYIQKTVEKYHDCLDIAGISLYSFSMNYQTGLPFEPIKDEHDVYFMNCAMSWGEVWMRDSWRRFYDWYLQHQDFPMMSHLPHRICSWNQKSWLKYHTRYCIEENKFFVHPYVSLSTNFGEAGEHNDGTGNTIYQVELQQGEKKYYELPKFGDEAVYYDGFFENTALYNKLGYTSDELCLDLQGEWHNRQKKRYWLTTEICNYKIVKSFGLNYRPIEANVLFGNSGNQIFLYDTSVVAKNSAKSSRKVMLYFYHLSNMFNFLRQYGFGNLFRDFMELVKHKIGV